MLGDAIAFKNIEKESDVGFLQISCTIAHLLAPNVMLLHIIVQIAEHRV